MISEPEWTRLMQGAGVGYDPLGPVATARQMTGGAMGQPPGTWGISGGPTGAVRENKGPDAVRERPLPGWLEAMSLEEIAASSPYPKEGNPNWPYAPGPAEVIPRADKGCRGASHEFVDVLAGVPCTCGAMRFEQGVGGVIRMVAVPRGTEGMVEA